MNRGFFKHKRSFFLLCILAVFSASSCFYISSPSMKLKKALLKGDCNKVKILFNSIENYDKKKKLLKKAIKVCLSSFPEISAEFYAYLSENEKDITVQIDLREQQANIYFEKLKNYEKALEVFFELKKINPNKALYTFRIAQAFFEMQKWKISLKSLNSLLKQIEEKKTLDFSNTAIPEILFLKARIFLLKKEYKSAENLFRTIKKDHPRFFDEKKIYFYLSLVYEIQKNFNFAIEELKNFRHSSDFLYYKINSLKIRKKNQPSSLRN